MTSRLEVGRGRNLWTYWTEKDGLARWADTPTPYRSLLAALLSEGVPPNQAHGLAANIYHRVKGVWPGKKDGHLTAGDQIAASLHK